MNKTEEEIQTDLIESLGLDLIDPGLNPKDYIYNSAEERFRAFAKNKKVEILAEFVNSNEKILLKCCECNKEFYKKPKNLKASGCPHCLQAYKNIEIYREHWKRSYQIIKDKNGTITQLSKFNKDTRPSLDDEFIVLCGDKHLFTTTHRKLAQDKWCPVCGKISNADGSKITSKAVYSFPMTSKNKEKRYRQVALQKGMQIISPLKDNIYELKCIECNEEITKTPKQLLENIYVCKNRCIRGSKVKLNALSSWEWKEND